MVELLKAAFADQVQPGFALGKLNVPGVISDPMLILFPNTQRVGFLESLQVQIPIAIRNADIQSAVTAI